MRYLLEQEMDIKKGIQGLELFIVICKIENEKTFC